MSNRFLAYLEREHARLEEAITDEGRKLVPETIKLARLKKTKLAIKDQISGWHAELSEPASR